MKAVVVFSGGQDSTTCLAIANHRHGEENVIPVIFDYGQKHRIEIDSALRILDSRGQLSQAVKLDLRGIFYNFHSSALIDPGKEISGEHEYLDQRPASFVPARNALFLTAAFGVAMEAGADFIYTGVSQADYSGYPDCREAFLDRLKNALNFGYERNIIFVTPLMHISKAETFALAEQYNILHEVLEISHTCYEGKRDPHEWGKGCGECPACQLRAKGWEEYKGGLL